MGYPQIRYRTQASSRFNALSSHKLLKLIVPIPTHDISKFSQKNLGLRLNQELSLEYCPQMQDIARRNKPLTTGFRLHHPAQLMLCLVKISNPAIGHRPIHPELCQLTQGTVHWSRRNLGSKLLGQLHLQLVQGMEGCL